MRNITTNPEVVQTVRSRVLTLLNRRNGAWRGTMTELLEAITQGRQVPSVWPGSPSSLRRVVNRVMPAIRRAGFRVQFVRTPDHERRRLVTFSRSR